MAVCQSRGPACLGITLTAKPPPPTPPRWSGLMRGAVSVAMVYLHFDDQGGKVGGGVLVAVCLSASEGRVAD